MKTSRLVLAFVGFVLFSAAAEADPAPKCKLREQADDHAVLYTNQDLEEAGGIDLDVDCLDPFLAVIRAGAPRPGHLRYNLLTRDLFPVINEILAAARESQTKLELYFSLPGVGEPEPDPLELTDIRVDLLPVP